MAEAGWYDDPLIPGGKRYWDGVQWTEHAQAPPSGAPAGAGVAPHGGPPPFAAAPVFGDTLTNYHDGQLSNIGEWIGASFRMVFRQLGPLTMFFALQFLFFAVGYYLIHQALVNVVIFRDGDVDGLSPGLLVAAAISMILAGLAGVVSLLASHHSLYGAHVGQRPDWSDSLSVGFTRLLRYAGVLILLYIGFYAAMGIAVGVVLALAAAVGAESGVVVATAVLLYIGALVFLLWASVKLVFITVAAAVVPAGTPIIKTAWGATSGHFWGILGRTLLLGIIVSFISIIPSIVFFFAISAIFLSQFGFLSDGTLTLDGQSLGSLDLFAFSSVLPNPVAVIMLLGLSVFLFGIVQSVVYSGSAALYADVGAPNSFGHPPG